MLPWPRGMTMKAASSGPSDEPALPPTWNNDCASPCRPPEAMRAMRDDSGWNTDEPIPTSAAAEQQRREALRVGQQHQPDEREAHAGRERIGPRPMIGVEPDERLEQRGGASDR